MNVLLSDVFWVTQLPPLSTLRLPCCFVFMAAYKNKSGHVIYTYKHRLSRRYVNLDKDGNFWRYLGLVQCGSSFGGRYEKARRGT